jgi:hypothetical protein
VRRPRVWKTLPALALPVLTGSGCGIPSNVAPIATGVPDGFVLARWVFPAASPGGRTERVTFAYRGQRYQALLAFPRSERRLPVVFATGDPAAPPPPATKDDPRVLVVVSPTTPSAAAVAMAKTLEEVDPAQVAATG